MPRQSRINLPGTLHHVMARGVQGQNIFLDRKDFDHFLHRLGELIAKSENACYAWALMKNHFHLLLRSGNEPLSLMMRRLLTGHAVYFNRRHKRSGHLFQNRFKSILCQEDTYFLQLVRYIHLNPVRTGEVKTLKTLGNYPYTGHAYLLGTHENDWQDEAFTLQWFGKQKNRSRSKYLDFIRDGFSEGKRSDLTGGGLLRTSGGWKGLQDAKKRGESMVGDERILGDSLFVEEALKKTEDHSHAFHTDQTCTLEELTEDISKAYGVDLIEVRSAAKQRHVTKAKGAICYIATRHFHLKGMEVAAYLNITSSAVSKLVTGFQADEQFQELLRNQFKKR